MNWILITILVLINVGCQDITNIEGNVIGNTESTCVFKLKDSFSGNINDLTGYVYYQHLVSETAPIALNATILKNVLDIQGC